MKCERNREDYPEGMLKMKKVLRENNLWDDSVGKLLDERCDPRINKNSNYDNNGVRERVREKDIFKTGVDVRCVCSQWIVMQ